MTDIRTHYIRVFIVWAVTLVALYLVQAYFT